MSIPDINRRVDAALAARDTAPGAIINDDKGPLWYRGLVTREGEEDADSASGAGSVAKGMNLAVSDVLMLAEALAEHYHDKSDAGIDGYSARALARVWKAERFSWWFTSITHRFPDMDGFSRRIQAAELDYIPGSVAAQRTLAENYGGLPLEAA